MASKTYYKNRNSAPFLSGDAFASLASAAITRASTDSNPWSSEKVRSATLLFCKGDLLREFLKTNHNFLSAEIIIVGNSDENFSTLDFPIPGSVKHLYIQNWAGKDSNVSVLPIGLENLRLGNNGKTSHLQNSHQNTQRLNRVLIGPFADTHPERVKLKSFSEVLGPWDYATQRLHSKAYAGMAHNYKFVACPQGNGIDTHRLWETLYRGSIPLVKRSRWSENISKLGFPLIELDDWSAPEVEAAIQGYREYLFCPREVPALWLNYWNDDFRAKIFS